MYSRRAVPRRIPGCDLLQVFGELLRSWGRPGRAQSLTGAPIGAHLAWETGTSPARGAPSPSLGRKSAWDAMAARFTLGARARGAFQEVIYSNILETYSAAGDAPGVCRASLALRLGVIMQAENES